MTASFLILTATLTIAAQEPAPTSTPKAAAPAVTVEGCVAAENEIPGRKANVAERAGLGEDFILVSAKVIKGRAPVAAVTDTTGGVVSNALRPMYEIGGLSGAQLKPHVGHRVHVDGAFANTRRAEGTAPLNDDLVELNATSIRQVPGACAPMPPKGN